MTQRIKLRTIAISYGLGPFHPAIMIGRRVMYWPNISKETEEEAVEFAANALCDVWEIAEARAQQWNVVEAS